jgi:ATP-binding cassette subfamily F protein uup
MNLQTLDLEMIEWLKAILKENITLFMVTHDRFLERVCNEIIELDNGKLYSYKGNYSYYLEKKKNALHLKIQVWIKRKIFCKKLEWMRRQPKREQIKIASG